MGILNGCLLPLALAVGGGLGAADFVPAIGTVDNVAGEGEVATCRGLGVVRRLEVLVLLRRVLAVVHAAGHRLGNGHIAIRSAYCRPVAANWTLILDVGSDFHLVATVRQFQSLGVELLLHVDGAAESRRNGLGG